MIVESRLMLWRRGGAGAKENDRPEGRPFQIEFETGDQAALRLRRAAKARPAMPEISKGAAAGRGTAVRLET